MMLGLWSLTQIWLLTWIAARGVWKSKVAALLAAPVDTRLPFRSAKLLMPVPSVAAVCSAVGRLASFSAVICGLAGALRALHLSIVPIDSLHYLLSGQAVMMCLLGGMGTFFGPFVGAAVFLTLEDEAGLANVIIRPDVFDRQRPLIMRAPIG